MTQQLQGIINGELRVQSLPEPEEQVVPGVHWGNAAAIFSPAYWAHILWLSGNSYQHFPSGRCDSLIEEIAFCLLGGYGITWEMNQAAFHQVRGTGLLQTPESASQESIEKYLRMPLNIGSRRAWYRFPKRKSEILAKALHEAARISFTKDDDLALRSQLLNVTGVGWKTASWIVRNWTGSDQVAILDVHIIRAGLLMGLFDTTDRVEKHYPKMEKRFVSLSAAMRVKTSELDMLMWEEMRSANHLAISMLKDKEARELSSATRLAVNRFDIRVPTLPPDA